jgi:hypothetical protein
MTKRNVKISEKRHFVGRAENEMDPAEIKVGTPGN